MVVWEPKQSEAEGCHGTETHVLMAEADSRCSAMPANGPKPGGEAADPPRPCAVPVPLHDEASCGKGPREPPAPPYVQPEAEILKSPQEVVVESELEVGAPFIVAHQAQRTLPWEAGLHPQCGWAAGEGLFCPQRGLEKASWR